MHFSGAVAALVVGSVILAIVVSFLLPVAFVAGLVWLVIRTVDALRVRRAVAADVDPRDTTSRDVGWAVGLLVAGVLWCVGRHHFAALVLGAGAAILTRGLLDMRRARV